MLVGRFVAHEGSLAVVDVRLDGALPVAIVEGKAFALTYCGGNRFVAVENDRQSARLEFFIRGGRAWGVRLGSRIYCRAD